MSNKINYTQPKFGTASFINGFVKPSPKSDAFRAYVEFRNDAWRVMAYGSGSVPVNLGSESSFWYDSLWLTKHSTDSALDAQMRKHGRTDWTRVGGQLSGNDIPTKNMMPWHVFVAQWLNIAVNRQRLPHGFKSREECIEWTAAMMHSVANESCLPDTDMPLCWSSGKSVVPCAAHLRMEDFSNRLMIITAGEYDQWLKDQRKGR